MNNPEFVALGTRCTAATILNLTNTRKNAYPFDWCDLPISAILELVKMPHSTDDEIKTYLDNYFNQVRSQRHPNGAWYPHDFIPTDNTEHQLADIKSKYFRRFKRMFDLFKSGNDIVFLTVLSNYEESQQWHYYELFSYLYMFRIKGSTCCISINLLNYPKTNFGHTNLVIPFYGDWGRFDSDIIAALKENEITNAYFK